MKPPAFDYHTPTSVPETLSLLAEHGQEGKILAGGQSLVPILNMRLAYPSVLIDINRITELDQVKSDGDEVVIGALMRQQELIDSSVIAERCPLLTEAVTFIGHRTIRNRGTVGGSVAHADPAAELPAALVALGATISTSGPSGERTIPAGDFFIDVFTTALEPDELLTSIQVPARRDRSGWAFTEVSRRHGDFALVGVAASVSLDDSGRCDDARIVMSGVSAAPYVGDVSSLVGQPPSDDLLSSAAGDAVAGLQPQADLHASANYRKHVARTLTQRALKTAFERARRGVPNA